MKKQQNIQKIDNIQSLYNNKREFERNLKRIKQSKEILKENKKITLEFKDYLLSEGISLARINRYFHELIKYNKFLKKPFNKADKQDIRRVVAKIEQTNLAPATKKCFKVAVRRLHRFIKGIDKKGKYPEEVEWISIHISKNHHKLPEELLTEEEILKIVQRCDNLRDKTLISTLAESGCRISEVGTMKIKHISFEEYGARLTVNGKTGMRKILVINSTPYLQEWLNQHPYNNNQESYLWINKQGKLLGYTRIAAILKNAAKRAKIKKRIYPHLLRHSRATFLATKMSDAAMKHYFGWTQGSDMAATYIHMSGKDTDDAILSANGIEINKNKNKSSAMKPKTCLRCKTINQATNKFCKLCGFALDEEEAEQLIKRETERKEVDDIMSKVVENKELLKMLIEKIGEPKCMP